MRLLQLAVLLFAFACSSHGGEVRYGTTAGTPDLIEIGPGVQVVADYDVPTFYSQGYYWRYDNGDWYRSNDYAGGFVYAEPPPDVRSIHQPERYVHYRPRGYVAHNRPERGPEPIMRGQNPEIDESGREQGEGPRDQHGPGRESLPPQPPEDVPPRPQPENMPTQPPPTRDNMPAPQPPPTRDNMPAPQAPPTHDNMPRPESPQPSE